MDPLKDVEDQNVAVDCLQSFDSEQAALDCALVDIQPADAGVAHVFVVIFVVAAVDAVVLA